MEGGQPDRPATLARLRARAPLRFISRCYVTACVSAAMWVRPEKMVETIQASQRC